MPDAKSGTAGTPVTPTDPDDAQEVTDASAGGVDDTSANPGSTSASSQDSVQVQAFKPPQTQDEKDQNPSWIEIKLLDEEGNPVPGEKYCIILPDGTTAAQGTLDENGFARVDGFQPGTCQVTFPDLDQSTWQDG